MAEPAESKAIPEQDLESQLDAMVAEVEQARTEVFKGQPPVDADRATAAAFAGAARPAPAPSPAAPPPPDAPLPTASLEPAVPTAPAAPAQDLSAGQDLLGDALATQIQELLDDARAQSPSAPAPPPGTPGTPGFPATPGTAGSPGTPGISATSATTARGSEAVRSAAAATPPSVVRPLTVAGGKTPPARETVAQIDSQLADQADDAVAGDFETPAGLIGEASETVSGPAQGGQVRGSAPPAAVPDAEDDLPLQGGFESPDQVEATIRAAAAGAAPAGRGATAAEVARELDTQPELAVRRPAVADPGPAAAAPARQGAGPLARLSLALRSLCAVLNAPVMGLSPQWRNCLGYVGLVTFVTGAVSIAVSLAMRH